MRILILNWRDIKNPKSGGAEIVTLEHAIAWVHAGHTVTWFSAAYPHSIASEVFKGIQFIRRGNNLTVYVQAMMYFLNNSFDLVVDEIHGIPFCTPLYVKNTKLLAFVHEVADTIWDYMHIFPFSSLGKFIEKYMYRFYAHIPIMTVSESTKKDLISLGLTEKMIHVVHNGLRVKSVKSYTGKENIPTFIFVSRIVRMKGIEEVLKSFALISSVQKHVQLWIVGTGESNYIQELKMMIENYDIQSTVKFILHPSDSEKLSLMRRSHILLHASIKEGWGLVVVEAASQATPSIVYNVSGLNESVKDGETGDVLVENTPKEMAEKSIALIRDKKRYALYQKNCLRWANSLKWKDSTKLSLALIESL
jgi:glycosyltransferase involved in cell wall biosynthesis